MSTEAVSILRNLFDDFWRLFNSFYLPGTNVTPAGLFLMIAVSTLVIKFIRHITLQTSHKEKDK